MNYECTECKGDATIGYSGFRDKFGKYIVSKKERLCVPCFQKRMRLKKKGGRRGLGK